jgi:hypothetical protein
MIRFACPACQSVLESPRRKAGEKVACPKHGQRLQFSPPTPPAVPGRPALGKALGSGSPRPRTATSPSAPTRQGSTTEALAIPTASDATPDRSFARVKTGLIAASIAAVICGGGGLALWVFTSPGAKNAGERIGAVFHVEDVPGDDEPPLTADERMAWNKLRRGINGNCDVAEYDIADKSWRWSTGNHLAVPFDAAMATKIGQDVAGQPAVKVAVVIDLYTAERPTPLLWCHDKGGGTQTTKRNPFPELDASLHAFVTHYQRQEIRPQ